MEKKDKLNYYKFLSSLPKKINKLYFGKLIGKFKLNNKSSKKDGFDPVTNIDKTLELFLRKEITKDSAIIRELHVYGAATAIGNDGKVQHRGWGKKLMQEAEKIAKKHKKNKMVVISGIGVREYYYNMNYKKEGPYVTKPLKL